MARWLALPLALGIAVAQDAPQKKLETTRPQPAADPKEEIPPEEDAALATTEYSFNPLQSAKDVGVGNQYLKRGKLRAAEMRYTSATKWNDGNAEAWLKLGEVAERLKDGAKARAAYERYLDLAADAKNAKDVRKRLQKLEATPTGSAGSSRSTRGKY
jgi:tetratricopeptide (TPR) repeat protein